MLAGFVAALAILAPMGMSRQWTGFTFLVATIGLYAGIGILSRTSRHRLPLGGMRAVTCTQVAQ